MLFRKVIRITAEDSPNVKLARAQIAAGREPTNEIVCPGVLTWTEYCERLRMWDEMEQCIGLRAEFYEGRAVKLFPQATLQRAKQLWPEVSKMVRHAEAIGVDAAEGGDNTSIFAVDKLGIIDWMSCKTADTNIIPGEVKSFGAKHNVPPQKWVFDRGGGGKQHADRLRAMGYPVRTIGFGEAPTLELKRGLYMVEARKDMKEQRYVYKNRRAQLYGELSIAFEAGFAVPPELYDELCLVQLAAFPKLYDGEDRLYLPPKNRKSAESDEVCLVDMIGHSPDEADALALAVFGMNCLPKQVTARVG